MMKNIRFSQFCQKQKKIDGDSSTNCLPKLNIILNEILY